MKTTIEINDFQIVIEENEGLISVSAMRDDEIVEEFQLESGEGSEGSDDEDLKAFGDDDSEGEDMGAQSEEEEDFDSESEEESEEEEDETKLESFMSFIKKKK